MGIQRAGGCRGNSQGYCFRVPEHQRHRGRQIFAAPPIRERQKSCIRGRVRSPQMLLRAHRSNLQATVFIRLLRQLRFLAKTDSTFARSFISRRLAEWKIRDCCIAWIVAGVNCESLLIITDVRLEQGQCDVLFQPR